MTPVDGHARTDTILGLKKHIIRFFLLLLSDFIFSFLSLYLSILLRFGFSFPHEYRPHFIHWWLGLFLFQALILYFSNLYKITLRFVGITEFFRLVEGFLLSITLSILFLLFTRASLPRIFHFSLGVLVIYNLLSFTFFGITRIARRIFDEIKYSNRRHGKQTIIIGANIKSERLIKDMRLSQSKLEPVAIADLDNTSIGTEIFKLPVVDFHTDISRVINRHAIEAALINLPNSSHHLIKSIFDKMRSTGVRDIRIVPRMDEWKSEINTIRKIDIEDLLSRDPVRIESQSIEMELLGKKILVSGAAGSIGSEIVRKLLRLGAKQVMAIDMDETGIFQLQQELKPILKNAKFDFIVGSITDENKMRRVFRRYQPNILFHAAAYKHVPLMEDFPEEALQTNVLGTFNLAQLAIEYKVEKFINISTDKAVKPNSVMGASKRLAEMICQSLNGTNTRFMSVRFGNVLGSRGSVVPLFQEQIRQGGPITITHPDMRRYFMSIPEAVLLVLQASHQGTGGEVFVLDMGEPVRIVDLADSLIRLNGLEPGKDIEIVFTGSRPGEKLYEEVLTAEEGVDATNHKKIFIARFSKNVPVDFLPRLLADCHHAIENPESVRPFFSQYIPMYN
jgi:FlaA1/EpsC-like NDP-sugar epimerase